LSVTDYVRLQNCTPNRMITLLPNDHAEEVTIFVLAELSMFFTHKQSHLLMY